MVKTDERRRLSCLPVFAFQKGDRATTPGTMVDPGLSSGEGNYVLREERAQRGGLGCPRALPRNI